MIWSLYAMLGRNMWWVDNPKLDFEDEAWDKILEACHKHAHARDDGHNSTLRHAHDDDVHAHARDDGHNSIPLPVILPAQ